MIWGSILQALTGDNQCTILAPATPISHKQLSAQQDDFTGEMCGTHIVLVTKRYLIQFKAHLTWEIFPCTINLDNFSWLMKSWSLRKGSMMLPCSTSRIPYRISNLTLVLTVKLSCHPKPKSSLQLIEVTMILFLKSLCLLIYFPFPLFFNFFHLEFVQCYLFWWRIFYFQSHLGIME